MLTDARKRSVYDQFGHAGLEGGPRRRILAPARPSATFSARCSATSSRAASAAAPRFSAARICATTSRSISSRRCSAPRPRFRFPRLSECKTCNGTGAAKGSAPKTCDTCHGQGQVRVQQSIFTIQQPCPRCKGRGKIIGNPCDSCYGQGRVRQEKTLSVSVPPGVDSGDRIRLSGEGEAGRNGGPTGDLYVEIRVREHAIFEREGSHLSCEVPDQLHHRSAWRLGRGADPVGRCGAQDPERDAIRTGLPHAREGRQARARRPARGPVLPCGSGDAGELKRGAKGAAEEVRGLAPDRAATSPASNPSSRA